MPSDVKKKDPQSVGDYLFDFGRQMVLDADTITGTPTVIATPAGLTVMSSPGIAIATGYDETDDDAPVSAGAVRAWLSGGVLGRTYQVECHVTTAGGRQWDKTLTIRCENT
jgi:hypothetical protein